MRAEAMNPGDYSAQLAGQYLSVGEVAMADRWQAKSKQNFGSANNYEVRKAFLEGRYDDAGRLARQGATATGLPGRPDVSPQALQILTDLDISAGRANEALARLLDNFPELSGSEPEFSSASGLFIVPVARALMALGQREQAMALLAKAEPWVRGRFRWTLGIPASSVVLARILSLEGKKAEALVELRAAVDAGNGVDWVFWTRDPAFDAIRDTPEFKQCVEIVKASNAKQLQAFRERPDL
jgi:hypothetical protein